MNVRSQAGAGVLVTCLASAALATPAAAAEAPVEVPLEALGTVLPMEPPTVRTGVPLPMPGTPQGLGATRDGRMQELLVPRTPLTAQSAGTRIAVPLPGLLGGRPLGTAAVTSPGTDLRTATPGATLGSPLSLPRGEALGLPDVELPQAGLLAPTLMGALESDMGLEPSES
ncbi:hypothetical protein [Streptomyces sp. NPDC047928]|uniref:hypothetical protein n=1 Tax=unclassified Streptomyces TaxID=2593676 RepID=UPI00371184AF